MSRLARNKGWGSQVALAGIGVLLGLLLGWLVLRDVDWSKVWLAFRGLPPALFVAGLVLVLAASYLRALHWRVLFLDERVRTFRLFLIENASIGLNSVSPVRVLAEPTMVGILTVRDRLSPGVVVATMAVTRVLDLAVTLLFVGIAIILLPALLPFAPLVVIATVASGAGIALLFLGGYGAQRIPRLRRLPFVASFAVAMRAMREHPRHVLASLALTVIYWFLVGLSGWVISLGIGHPLPVYLGVAVVLGAIFFATSVPGLPAALGTFEFAVVFILGLLGVTKETALTFGILVHLVLFLPPMVFAVLVLPREGLGSLKAVRAMLARWREDTKSVHPSEARER